MCFRLDSDESMWDWEYENYRDEKLIAQIEKEEKEKKEKENK